MKKYAIATLILIGPIASLGWAQQQDRSEPQTYTVEKGDTLWDLSQVFYENPWFWPRIWYANPPIENPHLIYPGQLIQIPGIKDAPAPVLAQVTEPEPVPEPVVEEEPVAEEIPYEEPLGEEDITLSSVEDQARSSRIDLNAVQSRKPIATARIRQTGGEEFLVNEEDYDNSPRMIRGDDRITTMYAEGDKIWINRGHKDKIHIGQKFIAASPLEEVESDRTDETLGFVMQPTGVLKVEKVLEDISLVTVLQSYNPVELSNILFEPFDLEKNINAIAPSKELRGEIVASSDSARLVGDWQRIFIDIGEDDGVERGHILTIYRPGSEASDGDNDFQLPPKVVASMVVVSTGENGATGLVFRASTPVLIGDTVRTPGI